MKAVSGLRERVVNQSFGLIVLMLLLVSSNIPEVQAINIVIDYRYDSNNFFNTQQKRDAMQAVADRFSEIITTSLTEAQLLDNANDWRIGFSHPGTGNSWEVSAANNLGSDSIYDAGAAAASEYRGPWTLPADSFVIYAGGMSLSSAGQGGTGTGTNFTTTYSNGSSHLNRGFRASGDVTALPMWGGSITFDNDANRTWHFDLTTQAPFSSTDFYSIALHEVGHVLGLSTSWADWTQNVSGSVFTGSKAVAAYNADNGTSRTSLNQVSAANGHWAEDAYDSKLFTGGNPQQVGTVGTGNFQDLLMEPTADFTSTQRRFELTNVDVAALEDIGWSVISAPPVGLAGDYNGDNVVNAADYAVWLQSLGGNSLLNESASIGIVDQADYTFWKSQFGQALASSTNGEVGTIPEPTSLLLSLMMLMGFSSRRLRQ